MKKVLDETEIIQKSAIEDFAETYTLAIKPEYTGKFKENYMNELMKDLKDCFEGEYVENTSRTYAKLAFFRLKKVSELHEISRIYKDKDALKDIEKKAKLYKQEYDFFSALAA